MRGGAGDLARVLNQEARALAEAGAPIVQFDEPAVLKHKSDLSLFSEACSILLEGVSAVTALCTYFGDVAGIASEFTSLPFDVIGLDFAMGSANFDLLEASPRDKALGLGVVDARNSKLETVEPAMSVRPEEMEPASRALGIVTQGLNSLTITHICYGEFENVFDQLIDLPVDMLDLEMANSEFRLLELLRRQPTDKYVAMGVVDSHNHSIEPVEEVKESIRSCWTPSPLRGSPWTPTAG